MITIAPFTIVGPLSPGAAFALFFEDPRAELHATVRWSWFWARVPE